MDDDRKAPPQAIPEDDTTPPAAEAPRDNPSKRRRTARGTEVVDVAADLDFRPGERIEVKWTINDDDESDEAGMKTDAEDGTQGVNSVTVWWPGTLGGKTDRAHLLTEEERRETEGANYELCRSPVIKLPIYNLDYAPLEEYGFDSHSTEEVAFISNQTLLNLSTDEVMLYRRVGEPSPPPSPIPEEMMAEDGSAISREFNDKDDIASFMNEMMQQCLVSTGMDKKMNSMPKSQQLVMAERIKMAKEGMLEKILEETDKMGEDNKVITSDVIHRCMKQMKGGY